jgi:hypothetical protein
MFENLSISYKYKITQPTLFYKSTINIYDFIEPCYFIMNMNKF